MSKLIDPFSSIAVVDRTILSQGQFMLLHRMALAYQEGGIEASVIDPDLTFLVDRKFCQQTPQGKWIPTEAGMRHITPKRRLTRRERRHIDSVMTDMMKKVH